jgi:hypothetical protein
VTLCGQWYDLRVVGGTVSLVCRLQAGHGGMHWAPTPGPNDPPDPLPHPKPVPPYQAHSATSREAAVSMIPQAGTLRRDVYEFLRCNGPATDEEIIASLGLSPNTARPRRVELMDAGLVGPCGTVLGPTGRKRTLWGVVEGAGG